MLLELHQQFDNIRKLQEQVGHCRKIERSGRPGTAPAYGLRRARKNFKSHAANTASRKASNSSSGVRYPSFLRGRPFSSSAAERMSSSEKASMELPSEQKRGAGRCAVRFAGAPKMCRDEQRKLWFPIVPLERSRQTRCHCRL